MHCLLANFTKREYVLLSAFKKARSVPSPYPEETALQDMLLAMGLLQGLPCDLHGEPDVCRLRGAWAGHKVAIIKGGDRSVNQLLSDELQGLAAMGAKVPTAYADIRKQFNPVSDQVLLLVRAYHKWQYLLDTWSCGRTAPPADYAWFGLEELKECLDEASRHGKKHFEQYMDWLLKRGDLAQEVRDFLDGCVFDDSALSLTNRRRWRRTA